MKKMTTMNDMFVAYQTHKGYAQQQNLEPIGFKEFTGIFMHFNSVHNSWLIGYDPTSTSAFAYSGTATSSTPAGSTGWVDWDESGEVWAV